MELSEADWPCLPLPHRGIQNVTQPPSRSRSEPWWKARSPAGLLYFRCSKKELRQSIIRRNLAFEFLEHARRREMINIMVKADDFATFPFFKLLPELRNRIYEELLLIKPGKRSCYPHILSSCSMVRLEATGILYQGNEIEVEIERGLAFGGAPAWRFWIKITGQGRENYFERALVSSPVMTASIWPTWLLRLPKVLITFDSDPAVIEGEQIAIVSSLLLFLGNSLSLWMISTAGRTQPMEHKNGDGLLHANSGRDAKEVGDHPRSLTAVLTDRLQQSMSLTAPTISFPAQSPVGDVLFGGDLVKMLTLVHEEVVAYEDVAEWGMLLGVQLNFDPEFDELQESWASSLLGAWTADEAKEETEKVIHRAVRLLDGAYQEVGRIPTNTDLGYQWEDRVKEALEATRARSAMLELRV